MEECPHCGEPLEDSAESCPHCGSDFETGWKSDLDYYSVELPEDDPMLPQEFPPREAEIPWETLVNLALVLASLVAFIWIAIVAYKSGKFGVREVTLFTAVLIGCLLLYYRWLYPARPSK